MTAKVARKLLANSKLFPDSEIKNSDVGCQQVHQSGMIWEYCCIDEHHGSNFKLGAADNVNIGTFLDSIRLEPRPESEES